MLFTALVGPHLVDWTSYREAFEREASRQLGRPVTVGGRATVRLLPTPVVSFTDVRVGAPDAPALVMESIRAELEMSPLLQGEINVVHMTVERPSFSVDLAGLAVPEGGLETPRLPLEFDRISLDEVEIVQGEALVFDSRTDRQWNARGINGILSLRSLQGPGRIEAGLELDGEPISVRAVAGRLEGAKLPLKLTVTPVNRHLVVSADGVLDLAAGQPVAYDGTFSVVRQAVPTAPADEAAPPEEASLLAFASLEGAFRLTRDRLALPEIRLAFGAPERPVMMVGDAGIDFGPEARFLLSAGARQIDLDRTLGGGPDEPVAIRAAGEILAESLRSLPMPPVPGSVRLKADGVVAGGSLIQEASAELRPNPDGWRIESLSAVLPGRTRVDLAASFGRGDAPAFSGRGRIASERPVAFATWWQGTPGRAAGMVRFAIEGELTLGDNLKAARNLVVDVDDSSLKGSVSRRRFAQAGKEFLTVQVEAGRLDVDDGLALVQLFGGEAMSGELDRIEVDFKADSVVAGGIEAKVVAVDGTLADNGLELANLSVGDLAGARLEARGRVADPLTDPKGRLDASVRAESLTGAAAFLANLLPTNPAVRHFQAVAPSLSPAEANLSVSAGEASDALSLDLTGSFAGTQIVIDAAGRGPIGDPAALGGRIDAVASAEDSATLLAQLGFRVTPVSGTGPGRLSLRLDGSPRSDLKLAFDGDLAGTRLSLDGDLVLDEETPTFVGGLEASSEDLDPLLLLSGVAVPGLGDRHGLTLAADVTAEGDRATLMLQRGSFSGAPLRGSAEVAFGLPVAFSGTLALKEASLPLLASFAIGALPEPEGGTWSDAPLAPGLPAALALDLNVEVEQLRLGAAETARNAAFHLAYADGGVEVDSLEADYAGGRLTGAASASIGEGGATIAVRGALEDAALEELVWERNGRPVARGTLDMSLEADGQGFSMSGIVSTLTGSGSFTATDGLVRFINPAAFSSVIRAADAGLTLEQEAVRSAFTGHLDAGTLPFERASGSFTITSGVLRVSTLSLDTASATVLGGATADLNRLTLASDWSVRVDPGADRVTGAEPEVGLVFNGPLADPQRRVDVMPLLGYLTVRAFERDVERIETLQADILEQERLSRRLRQQRQERAAREREAEPTETSPEAVDPDGGGPLSPDVLRQGAAVSGEAGSGEARRPWSLVPDAREAPVVTQ